MDRRNANGGQNCVQSSSEVVSWLSNTLHQVMNVDGETIRKGVVLSALLLSIMNNSSTQLAGFVSFQEKNDEKCVFEINHIYVQMSKRRNESDNFSHYEMIIADNSEGNKKGMAVLTAKSVDRELVEMDCSGMRENVIIDLNEEGRRWEGGELNGKPFGFG